MNHQILLDAGFRVFRPSDTSTYLYASIDGFIGYVQKGRFGGYDYTTVHVPNVQSGSGFRYEEGLPLAPRWMEGCCKGRPDWAVRMVAERYRSIEHFLKHHPHLKEFK